MKMKSTKKALLTSVLSLLLCCSMLIGTTFAWFTDSVESGSNIIKSGTLDVEMYFADGTKAVPADGSAEWTNADGVAIFNYKNWEPGYTEVRHIKIANEGTLALKYQILIKANGVVSKLSDVIDVYYCDPAIEAGVANRSDLTADKKLGTLTNALAGMSTTASGSLEAGKDVTVTLALKMQETAGNEYQGLSIGTDFSIILLATQYTSEDDSFNDQYDVNSKYDYYEGSATPNAVSVVVDARNEVGTKIASATIPGAAVNDFEAPIELIVIPVDKDENVTVDADQLAKSFEVTVTNLKEDNTAEIAVELRVGTGLSGVKLYHKGVLVPGAYYDGEYVKFKTTSFSPYTVVYDAEPAEPTPPSDNTVPQATVTIRDDLVGVKQNWLDAGSLVGADPMVEGQTLAVAYQYAAPHNADNIDSCVYKDWICDFYVKVDLAEGKTVENGNLPENLIFLGGCYGSYGWVGFNNPEVPVSTYIPLLQSVGAGWTYKDIALSVEQFICGVSRVEGTDADILNGATFTVKLRLVNPDNDAEYYDVSTVVYDFPTVVYSAEDLQDAIDNGDTNITLGGDIDLSNGIVIPGN